MTAIPGVFGSGETANDGCPPSARRTGIRTAIRASARGGSAFGRTLGAGAGRVATFLVRSLFDNGLERELAAVVDLRDLHEDLLADAEHVFDVLHALAAGELADLADVQQAVLAGQERDERAERRDLHHGAEELLADLRVGGVR